GHPADRVARSRLRGVRRRGLSGGAAPPRVTCAAGVVHSASAPRGAAYKPAAHPGGGGAGESWRRDLNSQPPGEATGIRPLRPVAQVPNLQARCWPTSRTMRTVPYIRDCFRWVNDGCDHRAEQLRGTKLKESET